MIMWCTSKDHFVYAPSQWEATLQCNIIPHWLGASTERSSYKSSQSSQLWMQHHIRVLTSCGQTTIWGISFNEIPFIVVRPHDVITLIIWVFQIFWSTYPSLKSNWWVLPVHVLSFPDWETCQFLVSPLYIFWSGKAWKVFSVFAFHSSICLSNSSVSLSIHRFVLLVVHSKQQR